MIVPALHGKPEPCLQAPAMRAASALCGGGLLGPMRRAKWNVAVHFEMAEPGRMMMIPVVEPEGRVGDFRCHCASPTVTWMLGCAGEDLSGRTLTQILGASPLRDTLFETCHQAFLNRLPQTAAVNGVEWRGSIDALPSSAGLTVVLTSSSAIERVIVAQRVLRELDQSSMIGR